MLGLFFAFLTIILPSKTMAVGPFAGPNYKVYKLGYLEGSLQAERFLTDANYDKNGKVSADGSIYGNYLKSYDYSYASRLTFTPNLAFSGGLITRTVDTDDGQLVRSHSGLGEIFLGSDYRWLLGETDLIVDYKFTFSPYQVPNPSSTDQPIWGDGANSSQVLLIIQRKFGSVLGYGFGGYNYRDHGLSDNYPLGLGVQWALSGLVIGSELKFSLLGDPDSYYTPSKSLRNDQLKKVNAGSYKYNSTNPEWATAELNVKYRLTSQFAVCGGGGTIFRGTNVADGNFWYLGLQLQWPVFLQENPGKAHVQKKEPDFIPDSPPVKNKSETQAVKPAENESTDE